MEAAAARHRLFFALVPETVSLEAIVSIQRRMSPGKGRGVPPERLHATLLFLGEQDHDRLGRLCAIASSLDFEPCRLSLDRCGHFPRARVAWLGASRVPSELQAFQARLSELVAAAGIGFDDRPWRMHLTLYRDLRTRPGRIEFEPVEWLVQDFRLLESVHDKDGLQYLRRGRWPA